MDQNWQTGYFWNQEGQETLHFQFQLNLIALKFWPYVGLGKKYKRSVHRSHITYCRSLKFCMRVTLPKGILSPSEQSWSHYFEKSRPTLLCNTGKNIFFLTIYVLESYYSKCFVTFVKLFLSIWWANEKHFYQKSVSVKKWAKNCTIYAVF